MAGGSRGVEGSLTRDPFSGSWITPKKFVHHSHEVGFPWVS